MAKVLTYERRIDYDEEADVLYVSVKRPQKATDTKFLADKGILLRYRVTDPLGETGLAVPSPRQKSNGRR